MSGVIGLGGLGPKRFSRLRAHQPGDAIFRIGETEGSQFMSHSGAAVGADMTVAMGLAHYFEFYDHQRPPQALAWRTPFLRY